jgi:hypothetical protein
MAVSPEQENAMLRYPMGLLAAGALVLGVGAAGANAMPRSEWTGRPLTTLDRVQFNDGGRCYNSCVSGRIFNRCQADPRFENKETCCNVVCNRVNNDTY